MTRGVRGVRGVCSTSRVALGCGLHYSTFTCKYMSIIGGHWTNRRGTETLVYRDTGDDKRD